MRMAKLSFGFSIGRTNALPCQRGFTLVELAIALAVVGLILGASLIPLRALDEARQLQDERRRLEVVRDAIVGYALRHRTRARTIQMRVRQGNFGFRPTDYSTWQFHLPGGRPYLPCPDWNGDGYEDRYPAGASGFVQGVEVRPDLTVTASIAFAGLLNRHPAWSHFGAYGDPYGFPFDGVPYGDCRTVRGAVPWRTLGIPPADGWGNRHTYFADPVFSNAIFGFDRRTIADMFDPRMPTAPGHAPGLGRFSRRIPITRFNPYVQKNVCPATICDGGRTRDCATHRYESADSCVWHQDLQDGLVLKAGAVAEDGIHDGRSFFPRGGVIDGIPLALVSHGPNGRFAVNHWATLRSPVDAFGMKSPVCNVQAWSVPAAFPGERRVDTRNRALAHEAANGSRNPSGGSENPRCVQVHGIHENQEFTFSEAIFVWEPPGLSHRGEFDDLLLWMTREELALAAPGDIPPLPRMVIAYFP